jgi:hypothetical protein
MARTWNRRGYDVYAMRMPRSSAALTPGHAYRAVLIRLMGEFARLPESDRDVAIDAAAEGYLAAHRESGGKVEALRRNG